MHDVIFAIFFLLLLVLPSGLGAYYLDRELPAG